MGATAIVVAATAEIATAAQIAVAATAPRAPVTKETPLIAVAFLTTAVRSGHRANVLARVTVSVRSVLSGSRAVSLGNAAHNRSAMGRVVDVGGAAATPPTMQHTTRGAGVGTAFGAIPEATLGTGIGGNSAKSSGVISKVVKGAATMMDSSIGHEMQTTTESEEMVLVQRPQMELSSTHHITSNSNSSSSMALLRLIIRLTARRSITMMANNNNNNKRPCSSQSIRRTNFPRTMTTDCDITTTAWWVVELKSIIHQALRSPRWSDLLPTVVLPWQKAFVEKRTGHCC